MASRGRHDRTTQSGYALGELRGIEFAECQSDAGYVGTAGAEVGRGKEPDTVLRGGSLDGTNVHLVEQQPNEKSSRRNLPRSMRGT